MAGIRKHLSPKNLFSTVREKFLKIKDASKRSNTNKIKPVDSLMSGLAVFSLKFPSLLKFEEERSTSKIKQNLLTLFGVKESTSDTHMRRQLDEISPSQIRPAFKQIFSLLQRGKALKGYYYSLNSKQDDERDLGGYLLSIDGTGQYSSDKVHCAECCEKHHKDGRVEYYHQMLGASIVYPGNPIVIPLAPEPITKQDGATKNDCERNAAKRLLENIKREHPHLKFIIVEDAHSSNGPHVELIKSLDMSFILGVKPDGNKSLFDWVSQGYTEHEITDEKGIIHQFRIFNGATLNDTYPDLKVNFLDYWEIHPNGKKQHFSWITDFLLTKNNVMKIMRGGRARWKIENETFNTLKNQGYNFEHNYGHGNKHLCSVFTMLMLLSFLIDQSLELCCVIYKAARKRERTKYSLWEKIRVLFTYFNWNTWEDFLGAIVTREMPVPLNST